MTPRLKYFKRYRMELLLRPDLLAPELPPGYSFVPWKENLCDIHADIKFRCFVDDIDARVFPNLGSVIGCRELMNAIRCQATFCPSATWLLAGPDGYVGTVQGLLDHNRVGAIQNLGIVPDQRGLGLGTALLLKALQGFKQARATQVMLEVTAENTPAVKLYRAQGFRNIRTVYKPVMLTETVASGAGI